jgi:hypothetical protein
MFSYCAFWIATLAARARHEFDLVCAFDVVGHVDR